MFHRIHSHFYINYSTFFWLRAPAMYCLHCKCVVCFMPSSLRSNLGRLSSLLFVHQTGFDFNSFLFIFNVVIKAQRMENASQLLWNSISTAWIAGYWLQCNHFRAYCKILLARYNIRVNWSNQCDKLCNFHYPSKCIAVTCIQPTCIKMKWEKKKWQRQSLKEYSKKYFILDRWKLYSINKLNGNDITSKRYKQLR